MRISCGGESREKKNDFVVKWGGKVNRIFLLFGEKSRFLITDVGDDLIVMS